METQLQISVCIPMYNSSPYLRECIDSVLNQTYENFELLIVDDGSSDNSTDIIKSYQDSRIRLFKNKHNFIESLNLLLMRISSWLSDSKTLVSNKNGLVKKLIK